jgi:glycosyltransferase involved in cell wall biosynthesis
MVSFRDRLGRRLGELGYEIVDDLADPRLDAVLVIGGTRRLADLWRARRRGARIVQRLNGMNWLHRVRAGVNTDLRHYLRAEYGNRLLAFTRSRLADQIVYQSNFSQNWWEREYGPTRVPSTVVYNGVDLRSYHPDGEEQRPAGGIRILLVEGSLLGGYEQGLDVAVRLGQGVAARLDAVVELQVVGRVSEAVRQSWDGRITARPVPGFSLAWAGLQPSERIPVMDRSAHVLYSSDINAACPNSVVEALACGLPVAALDTGALPEMVSGDAGRVVPYGGDPWRLAPPNITGLVEAVCEIAGQQERFRAGARQRAESQFGLKQMVEGYLRALLPGYSPRTQGL